MEAMSRAPNDLMSGCCATYRWNAALPVVLAPFTVAGSPMSSCEDGTYAQLSAS